MAKDLSATDKLDVIMLVLTSDYSVSEICDSYDISRQTWYRWFKELQDAVGPSWGKLTKRKV